MTDFFLGIFGKKISIYYPFHIGQSYYVTFEDCSQINKVLSVSTYTGQMSSHLCFCLSLIRIIYFIIE